MAVEIGDVAPDFELPDQHGTPVKLSSFRGVKNVVLVFYPLAFSPVCSGELCAMREDFPEVADDDVELLTVSVDSFFAHKTSVVAYDSFRFTESVTLLAAVILGGMGTIPGAVLGASILFVLPEKLREFAARQIAQAK